ncbi:hypothetical protein [Polymorphobacter megasporae]|uniref:hypothetical protein n=1 Tax=Glacieibacterium megasporae TaxID=2835787 RepID=UPI001C1DF253|nr:hypothetical protein [Polymorphobacter megasporae]UAJ09460.1 hypothetical protein KTC28_14235 [Polymorphobacter megasporae]
MIAVLICSIVNSALIVGLLGGIVVGFIRARVAIAAALFDDPLASAVTAPVAPLQAVAA